MTRRIYILDCAGASRDELRSRALAAGLRVMDVRLDEDHAEVDVDGDGIPDWGCATVDVVEVSSLEGAGDPVRRGLELMASGRFWEAHEVLESPWHDTPGSAGESLGFLVKCCAAAVHVQRGRMESALGIVGRSTTADVDQSYLGGLVAGLRNECRGADRRLTRILREFARRALEEMDAAGRYSVEN